MDKELLPIGSVVQLENSTALVMVAGYLPVAPSRPDYIWDYSGFRFPIGFTDNDAVYCFDHRQIQVVYAYGYKQADGRPGTCGRYGEVRTSGAGGAPGGESGSSSKI